MKNPDCSCPKTECVRHGDCDPCRQYHASKGKVPRCERQKRSMFGSIKGIFGIR